MHTKPSFILCRSFPDRCTLPKDHQSFIIVSTPSVPSQYMHENTQLSYFACSKFSHLVSVRMLICSVFELGRFQASTRAKAGIKLETVRIFFWKTFLLSCFFEVKRVLRFVLGRVTRLLVVGGGVRKLISYFNLLVEFSR